MRLPICTLALSALFVFGGGELQGQEESAAEFEQELRALIAEPSAEDLDRRVVSAFLDRDDVSEAAAAHRLDLDRVRARLNMIEGEQLATLARHAEGARAEGDLVGGNTIVISSTTVIIILLILILVS